MQWAIDAAHTSVSFAVRHMMISTVRGQFNKVSGSAEVENGKVQGVHVDVDIASIDTREDQRDTHLRSADFFDAENHPTLHFSSDKVEHVGGDRYRIVGELMIHGTKKPFTLEATITDAVRDSWGNDRLGVSAVGTMNRSDFGLKWNVALEAGGVMVADQVKFEVDAEFYHPAS